MRTVILTKLNNILTSTLISVCLSFVGCIYAKAAEPQSSKEPAWLVQQVTLKGDSLTFTEGIESLSTQIHHAILADGVPNRKSWSWDMKKSVKETLDSYSDKFDYSWSISKQGAILLRKRFHYPEELPQMHFAEMLQMTRDVVKSLTALQYDTDASHLNQIFLNMYHSMSPEQLDWLHAENRIAYNDLLPQQKIFAEQAILNHAMAYNLRNWKRLNDELESVPSVILRGKPDARRLPNSSLSFDPYLFTFIYSRYPASEGTNGGVVLFRRNLLKEGIAK